MPPSSPPSRGGGSRPRTVSLEAILDDLKRREGRDE